MSTKSARFVVSAVALLMPFYLSGLAGCGTPQQQAEPEAAREPIPEPVSDEPIPEPVSDEPTLASKDVPLAINNVVPTRGLVESNTIVLVEGEGFTPGMWVYFGDQPAKEVFVLTDGMLTAITPAHPTGTVDVRLDAQVQGQRYEVGMPEAFAFFALPDEDPGTDKDGDGLTDLEEITGWDIKVDIFGFGLNPGHFGSFLEHHVDSNPGVGETDTDNDGLTDLEEFFVKSNPRDPDTDGDGLWDGEEWHRWLTSPISVDTDGDARSADPSSPQSTLPPNASLFDGAELYDFIELAKDPADRGPIKFNATSPTLDDTDGDNVSDSDEIDTPVRTPLLADMPQLLFEIVDDVDMRLDIEYAEEEGRTTAFETSFATATEVTSGETSTTGTTAGTSTTESDWNSNTVSASVTVGVEVGFG
ncbi:MAG: IPT/TIG domain-containing protein, partial [Planctomycetes bacterium]|nr:IPT/TIG domain-containing protein [Planctomycetota bacterium]